MIFKFRNPAFGSIYARFLQLHSRNQFEHESKYWSDQQNSQRRDNIVLEEEEEDESVGVDLPILHPDQSQLYFHYYLPLFFMHSALSCINKAKKL